MSTKRLPDHARFAGLFVREYWLDVIEHPGLEPVTETIDELLAGVSYRIEPTPVTGQFQISMWDKLGDVWNFAVRYRNREYEVLGMNNGSMDLFNMIYGPTFRPMMARILKRCRLTGYQ